MEKIKTPELNIIDNLKNRNVNNLDIPSIEYFGNVFTYREMFSMIEHYAKSFKNIGVKNGDLVTITLAGSPESIFCFYALNRLGAVVNFVNPNYLKFDSKKYINDTNSKVLVILDKFYKELVDELSQTNVEKIILTSLDYYALGLDKKILKDKYYVDIKKEDLIKNIDYFNIDSFLYAGNNEFLDKIDYVKGKEAGIFYTSGTTGYPKGVVLTNDGFNNMIAMYDAMDGMGRVPGDRNLVLIPNSYATGMSHCTNAPFAFGCTNVLQPIYDKRTFAFDLKRYRPNIVTAAASHYATLFDSDLIPGDLSCLKYPCTGGEAVTKEFAIKASNYLMSMGAHEPLVMGYGMSEFGCMVMINHGIDGRTNEAGITMPFVEARIVDPITKKVLKVNERGEIQVITPCIMKGYYNRDDLTNNVFVEDGNKKWARTFDVGMKGSDGLYYAFGRLNDSFIDDKGNVVYLFDYEKVISKFDFVLEYEVVVMKIHDKNYPVIHLILKNEYKDINSYKDILISLDKELKSIFVDNPPYCYKIREEFNTSPISGKRDYEMLKAETNDFIFVINDDIIMSNIDADVNVTENQKIKKLNLKL